jgi:hypothetical protein
MHILHGILGYSLIGPDYKLTIFSVRWHAGTFCADVQMADDGVHQGGAGHKFPVLDPS